MGLRVATLAAAGLLIAAGNASALMAGGIFKVGTTGASVQIDPQVAYVTTAWSLEYATAAKLFNYPDKPGLAGAKLVPEVASKFTVSNGGKVYTFTIRKGFRFSDGRSVTAKSFKYAIDRVANKALASPGAQFITDPNGTNIVGAQAVNDGQGTSVSGVTANGNKLIIHLTKADGTFMSKITMPFFQATSTKLPLNKEVENVSSMKDIPSAGPYAFSLNRPNDLTVIKRNSYYRGPRSHHLDGYQIKWNLEEQAAFTQTLANQLDEGPLPAANIQQIADRFGVNKSRFWVKPVNCVGYIAFNNLNGLFADNPQMRKAVNWALDRTDFVAQLPPYSGSPWTHILPPGMPGLQKAQPYGVHANLQKATALAAGHFKDGRIALAYAPRNTPQGDVVRRDLIRLGFKPGDISNICVGLCGPIRPTPHWDLWVGTGWCADYLDPSSSFVLLNTGSGVPPEYKQKIAAANKLVGPPRYKAFGKLDLEIMEDVAPIAPMRTYNNRFFFSDRVDPRRLVYQPVYTDWSIPALGLK